MRYLKTYKLFEQTAKYGKLIDHKELYSQIPKIPKNYIRIAHSTKPYNIDSILSDGLKNIKQNGLDSNFVGFGPESELYTHGEGSTALFLVDITQDEHEKLQYHQLKKYGIKNKIMPKERIVGYINIEDLTFTKNKNYNINIPLEMVQMNKILKHDGLPGHKYKRNKITDKPADIDTTYNANDDNVITFSDDW